MGHNLVCDPCSHYSDRANAALNDLLNTEIPKGSAPYPDAKRDYFTIKDAARIRDVDMQKLRFPLVKNIIPAFFTAIVKIPELVGYIFGSDEGFQTAHVIEFESGGETLTCGAMVTLKPDNSLYVSVSNCGTDGLHLFRSENLIPRTQVK